jgi:hypothetical protein
MCEPFNLTQRGCNLPGTQTDKRRSQVESKTLKTFVCQTAGVQDEITLERIDSFWLSEHSRKTLLGDRAKATQNTALAQG